MLSHDDLIAIGQRTEIKKIPGGVPGIGELWVKECSEEDIDWVLDESVDNKIGMARMICVSACDEAGNLVFGREDVEAVAKFKYGKKNRIAIHSYRINGLSTEPDKPGKN
jgi:hypothetical protein